MSIDRNICKRKFSPFPVCDGHVQSADAVCNRWRLSIVVADAFCLHRLPILATATGALRRQSAAVVGAAGRSLFSPPTLAAGPRRPPPPPAILARSRRPQSPPTVAAGSSTLCNFWADLPTAESHRRFSQPTPQELLILCPATVDGDCRRRLSMASLMAGSVPCWSPSPANDRGRRRPLGAAIGACQRHRCSAITAGGFCGRLPSPPTIGGDGRRPRLEATVVTQGCSTFFWRRSC